MSNKKATGVLSPPSTPRVGGSGKPNLVNGIDPSQLSLKQLIGALKATTDEDKLAALGAHCASDSELPPQPPSPTLSARSFTSAEDDKTSTYSTTTLISQELKDATRVEAERLFRAVLTDDIMRAGFQQYAVKSWCVEAVNFWNAVQVFKQAVSGDLSRSEKVAKATAVFKSYISDDAELQVNIDHRLAVAAKEKFEMLARDENSFEVTRNIFAEIEESVFQQMLTDTFRKWRATKDYNDAVQLYFKRLVNQTQVKAA